MKTTHLLSTSLLWLATLTSASAQIVSGFKPAIGSLTQLQNLSTVAVTRPAVIETVNTGLRPTAATSLRQGVPAPRRQATTFVGAVAGTKARIAILSDGVSATAFVTDGAASTSLTAWLEGTAVNGVLKLDGAPCLPRPATAPSLTGTVTAATVRGSLRIAGKTRSFSAVKTTTPGAGVYHRAEPAALIAAIVDDRGTVVSAARHLGNRLLGRARVLGVPSQGVATVSVTRAGTSNVGTVRLKLVREPMPGLRWLWNNRPSSATKAAVITIVGDANHLGQPIKPFDIQVVPNQEAVSVFMFTDQRNQSVMLNQPLLDAFETGTLMEQANFRGSQIQVYDLALSQGQAAISTQHFQTTNGSTFRTDCRVELTQLQSNGTLSGTNALFMGAQAGAPPQINGLSSLVLFDAGTRVTRVPNGGFLMTNPGTPVDLARRHFGNVHFFATGAASTSVLVSPLFSPIELGIDRAIALHANSVTRVSLGSRVFASRDDGGMLHTLDNAGIVPVFRPVPLSASFLKRFFNTVHAADMAEMDGDLVIAVNGRGIPATQSFAGAFVHASDTRCRDFWALLRVSRGEVEVLSHAIDNTPNSKGDLDAAITGIDVLQAPEGSHILMADNGVRTPGTNPMGESGLPTLVSPSLGALPPPNDQHLAAGRILRWSPSQQAADALELRTLQERQRRNP